MDRRTTLQTEPAAGAGIPHAAERGLSDRAWLLRGAFGIVLYASLVLLPLAFMLLSARPEGRSFLRELSVALAFGGLAILGLQVVVTARLRRLKAPYGIDAVYHFHRQISFVALALIVAHPILLIADDPATLSLFNPLEAPLRARLAVTSLVALVAVVTLSAFRRRLGLKYEIWRRSHGALALVMLACAVAHVQLVGHYVNTPLKRELWLVYPALWIAALGWTRLVKPFLLLRRPWKVASVRRERGSAWTLSLAAPGRRLRFDPGQFVWLHLRSSPFAMAEHPFSVSSSAENPERLEVTVKSLGDFTASVPRFRGGETAYVDGPYGQFSVDRHAAHEYVFVAGGVGITPIMSMLRTLADRADGRRLTLVYGSATLDDMTFFEEIESLTKRLDLTFVPVPSQPPSGWSGESGRIDQAVLARHVRAPRESEVFVCGPEAMMDSVASSLRALGVRPGQIRYELFALV